MCVQHDQKHAQLPRCGNEVPGTPHEALNSEINLTVMFAGSFTETELGEVKFPEISTAILEKVCQYFYYKLRYQNA